jgi:hypothetical protein
MSIKVMSSVWENSKQKGNPLLVLLSLADHSNDRGECFPSYNTIARKARITKRSAMRIIKQLEEAGELEITRRHSQLGDCTSNVYRIKGVVTESHHRSDAGVTTPGDAGVTTIVNHQVEPSPEKDSTQLDEDWQWFLKGWRTHFPNKPQPRRNNATLKKKLATRLKSDFFTANYLTALMRASESKFLQAGSWFTAGWFLKNEMNWEKCYDGNYDDQQEVSKQTEAKRKSDEKLRGMMPDAFESYMAATDESEDKYYEYPEPT